MSQSSHNPIRETDVSAVGSDAMQTTASGTPEQDDAAPATVLLFDPLTDTSPYAHKPKKMKAPGEKPSARRPAKRAQTSVSEPDPSADSPHAQLHIVSDDPGEIARYAVAQQRSDADRTLAGAQSQAVTDLQNDDVVSPDVVSPYDVSPYDVSPYEKTYKEQPSSIRHRFVKEYIEECGSESVAPINCQQSDEISPYDKTVRPKKSARGPRVTTKQADSITFATSTAEQDVTADTSEETDSLLQTKPSVRRHMPKASAAAWVGLGSHVHRHAHRAKTDDEPKADDSIRRSHRRPRHPERRWNRALVTVTTLTTIAVALVLLYFPAQNMYASIRENERLTDELDKNLERNSLMQDRVSTLQTAEGIQDEARSVYGMVGAGETAVSVIGIEDDTSTTPLLTEIPRGSGENTNTWFTDLLDRIFGITDTASIAEVSDVAILTDTIAEDSDGAPDNDASEVTETFEADAMADIVAQGDEQAE